MKMLKSLLIVCASFASLSVMAGGDQFNWGAQPEVAKKKWMALQTAMESKNYSEARAYIPWLITNAPKISSSLYIYAAEAYEMEERKATDANEKRTLQDSTLLTYDLRIVHFQDEANVLNRKGRLAYYYLYNRSGKTEELYTLYKRIAELNGKSMYASNGASYMAVLGMMKKAGKLTEEEVIKEYFAVLDMLDFQLDYYKNDAATVSSITGYQDYVMQTFAQTGIVISCDQTIATYGEKFKATGDLKYAKTLARDLASCPAEPLYLSSILAMEANATDDVVKSKWNQKAGIAYYNQGNIDSAVYRFDQSIALDPENKELAEKLNMKSAELYSSQGRYAKMREYARKADTPEAHEMIAKAYVKSYKDISQKDGDEFKARLVFIAAYNEYQKAGNKAKMEEAKKQFPSMEQIFERNMKEGDSVSIGSWVNETVTLKKR